MTSLTIYFNLVFMEDPIKKLNILDPGLGARAALWAEENNVSRKSWEAEFVYRETVWAVEQEESFARALFTGYLSITGRLAKTKVLQYRKLVRDAAKTGPGLAKIMATSLVPVLRHGDEDFMNRFLAVCHVMLAKGTYTLSAPLETISFLLKSNDLSAGYAFLELLDKTFSRELTYNASRHLASIIPRAVRDFPAGKRTFQIQAVTRIVDKDHRLVERFLDSMKSSLSSLNKDGLEAFVKQGLDKFETNQQLGEKFLFLESRLALETTAELQKSVSFFQVREKLNRYLTARTGTSLSVARLSELPAGMARQEIGAVSDGKLIYLPEEIGLYKTKEQNQSIYKIFAQLEAGLVEKSTFDFDLEKLFERTKHFKGLTVPEPRYNEEGKTGLHDMEKFFSFFPEPGLAADLFLVFEHGRIAGWLRKTYPGVIQRSRPILQKEALRMERAGIGGGLLFHLYGALAIRMDSSVPSEMSRPEAKLILETISLFCKEIKDDPGVETSGVLVLLVYDKFERFLNKFRKNKQGASFVRLVTPFHRGLLPGLYMKAFDKYEKVAERLKTRLGERGIKVFRSEIARALREGKGELSENNIQLIIAGTGKNIQGLPVTADILKGMDFSEFLDNSNSAHNQSLKSDDSLFRYKEWSARLGDYLQDYVLVRERGVADVAGDEFYANALEKNRGLLKKLRYSFELLKPQELSILRRWPEGDAFDYRALLDFVLDRKAGIMPSQRLYIKKLKQVRDVSVLLLVDLSRSTANKVAGSDVTVLELEKQAIVIFCEALEVLGDSFSIAGFSGTGRLGVDYYMIKDFYEPMGGNIKARIGAVSPQRSTRMGAAIRHAASRFDDIGSKVRLLLILGDGYPNDLGYKQNYAIEDTRRALVEARARNIAAHSITVNIQADAGLDEVYGRIHHNVISDVRELPAKLLKIYGALTR